MKNNEKKTLFQNIKERILFIVDKEEKTYIRKKVMERDHKSFMRLLIVIFILQLGMVAYTLISSGFKIDSPRRILYVSCYCGLALVCIIALLVSDYFFDRKKEKGYFVVVTVVLNFIFIWGVSVTLGDCYYGSDLTTFSYVALALASLIILEPWIFIVDTLVYVGVLNIALYFMLTPKGTYYPSSIVISSVSIAILTMIAATINFNRRTSSLKLEKDVTELNDTLQKNMFMDVLTNIHNRRFLTDHINDTMSLGLKPSGIIMFDIDDFKNVNDEYGHQNGDLILEQLGRIISTLTIEDNSYAVRYGGEEFLIYFKHTTKDDLYEFAEAICQEVADNKFTLLDGEQINIHISVGAALAKPGRNYSDLINQADANLYKAKNSGKNCVIFE